MSFSLRSSRFPQLEPLTDSSSPSSSSLALAEHTHYAAASAFLRLIRAKAPISEAEDELASFQKALESERGLSAAEADKVKRDLAVQTVLNVGSRSFSHFLNALERYLTLLRALTSSAPARQDLLTTVAAFWRRHPQFHLIVLDKLLQYRLVDTRDVTAWVFAPADEQPGARTKTWSDIDLWQMLQVTLRTVQFRVDSARARLEGLRREDEARGAEGGGEELDAEGGALDPLFLSLRSSPADSPFSSSFPLPASPPASSPHTSLDEQMSPFATRRTTPRSRRPPRTSPSPKPSRPRRSSISSGTGPSCSPARGRATRRPRRTPTTRSRARTSGSGGGPSGGCASSAARCVPSLPVSLSLLRLPHRRSTPSDSRELTRFGTHTHSGSRTSTSSRPRSRTASTSSTSARRRPPSRPSSTLQRRGTTLRERELGARRGRERGSQGAVRAGRDEEGFAEKLRARACQFVFLSLVPSVFESERAKR